MHQQTLILEQPTQAINQIGVRKQYRNHYGLKQDPIYNDISSQCLRKWTILKERV